MNIQDLVPPLELCKLIPKGELEFSYAHWCFVWAKENEKVDGDPIVGWWQIVTNSLLIYSSEKPTDLQRKDLIEKISGGNERACVVCEKSYPAPTLEEILVEIGKYGIRVDKIKIYDTKKNNRLVEEAMNVWLRLREISTME